MLVAYATQARCGIFVQIAVVICTDTIKIQYFLVSLFFETQ